jgi:hypothetical protein
VSSGTFTPRLKRVIELSPNGNIGLDVYPVPEIGVSAEVFREALNKKIIDHYWNREIGLESLSMFRFNLRRKMAEVMPYYVKLYKTELIAFDPLSTINIESDGNQASTSNSKGTQTSESDSDSNAESIASDFPQTQYNSTDGAIYGTTGQNSKATGKNTGTGSDERDDTVSGETKSTTKGYTGIASELLMRYRATLLNVDMQVIAELEELFMQIWDNGDTYTESDYV